MLRLLPLLILSAGVLQAQEAKRPNIVLIMADDLGYGDVGFNGGPYKTPHLDKLAQTGSRLKQHYSLPVCSPTRSSLLSGRFNSRFGCTSPTNERVYPFETVTLASALKSLGYRTGLVGKWHLGSRLEWGPQRFGFDHTYGSLAGGVTSYTHVYKKGDFSETWHRNGKLIEEKGHVTDLITKEATDFIEAKPGGPFFLYVPYTAVHLPIDEPKEWQDLYPDAKDEAVRQYGACISHLDAGVGKIVAALDKSGQRENTLIIFISDNGGSIGTENFDPRYAGTHPSFRIPALNRPFRGSKGTLYEGGIRTPALVNWPGKIPAGKEVPAPIHVADWFPTLAHLTGYKSKTDLKWDGANMWSALLGEKMESPRTLYWMGPGGTTALRHGDHVLLTFKGNKVELYDLAKDSAQAKDLAAAEPARVRELQALQQRVALRDFDARVKK